MKIYTAVVCMAALAVLAGAAAAQQDAQTPQTEPMEHHEMQAPMGRPEPEPQMMPEASPGAAPEAEEQSEGEGPFGVGQGRGMQCTCPMCQMGRARGQGRAMEMRMKQAGVPDETMTRARMLMRAKIHPADPQGLLALQNELGLTDEQKQSLENIIDSAQEQALGVLNAEQWEKVRELKPRAASMMEMHRMMMPMMRAMRGAMRGAMPQGPGGAPGGGMMENMMQEQEQAPYGKPQTGETQQEQSSGPMKPGCK